MTVRLELSADDASALEKVANHEDAYGDERERPAWFAIGERARSVKDDGGTIHLSPRWARLLRVHLEMYDPAELLGLDQTVAPQLSVSQEDCELYLFWPSGPGSLRRGHPGAGLRCRKHDRVTCPSLAYGGDDS